MTLTMTFAGVRAARTGSSRRVLRIGDAARQHHEHHAAAFPHTVGKRGREASPSGPSRLRSGCRSCEAACMADKHDLKKWIVQALEAAGRELSVTEVAKAVWQEHEDELRASDDLFYSWQYDLRWAAQELRGEGVLAAKHGRRTGGWRLAD